MHLRGMSFTWMTALASLALWLVGGFVWAPIMQRLFLRESRKRLLFYSELKDHAQSAAPPADVLASENKSPGAVSVKVTYYSFTEQLLLGLLAMCGTPARALQAVILPVILSIAVLYLYGLCAFPAALVSLRWWLMFVTLAAALMALFVLLTALGSRRALKRLWPKTGYIDLVFDQGGINRKRLLVAAW
jgi:hypothetical protein